MIEKKTSLGQEQAYAEIRALLQREEGKIVAEDPPRSIEVEHGSFWDFSPRDMSKRLKLDFWGTNDGGTRIEIRSSVPIWDKVSFVVVLIVLLGVGTLGWVARETLPGWLVELSDVTSYAEVLTYIETAKTILGVLTVTVLVIVIFQLYQYSRREAFGGELATLVPD
ncbi:MAG: hypothetical protein ACE5KH_06825 [Candidatus Geothermarchaeales archaeon]